jgi:hypothetical protein
VSPGRADDRVRIPIVGGNQSLEESKRFAGGGSRLDRRRASASGWVLEAVRVFAQ